MAFSPTAVIATPMNSEKMTICRISLFAIASMPDLGKMWVMKLERLKALCSTPAEAVAGRQREVEADAGLEQVDEHQAEASARSGWRR